MKKLAILGSTGSIGVSTLKVARHLGEQVKVVSLAARSNIDLLEQQALEFNPEVIAVYEEDKAQELRKRLPRAHIVSGMEGLKEAATVSSATFVVSALVGIAGLIPTVAAIKAGKDIGLANKEALVAAGEVVTGLVKKHGVRLLPIDSEHSAIFQCLLSGTPSEVRRLIITASGGPFRACTPEELGRVTFRDALKHPTWQMGAKITIDSSTLMNKGLEFIEAHWLFGTPLNNIEVVVHPQSIIHSMVEFVDGSIIAQMNKPDMINPIQYAITYPDRLPGIVPPFDFLSCGALEFYAPDTQKFPCLRLAFEAIRSGGSLPCYMNGANEILVSRFLQGQLGWQEIGRKLEVLMSRHHTERSPSLDTLLAVDATARREASLI